MRTHIRPSSHTLNPVIGFTFLAGFDTKWVILLLKNRDQDLTISLLPLERRRIELTLLCIRTPPRRELASWNKCLVTAFQLCPMNMVPPPYLISLPRLMKRQLTSLPISLAVTVAKLGNKTFIEGHSFALGFPTRSLASFPFMNL